MKRLVIYLENECSIYFCAVSKNKKLILPKLIKNLMYAH